MTRSQSAASMPQDKIAKAPVPAAAAPVPPKSPKGKGKRSAKGESEIEEGTLGDSDATASTNTTKETMATSLGPKEKGKGKGRAKVDQVDPSPPKAARPKGFLNLEKCKGSGGQCGGKAKNDCCFGLCLRCCCREGGMGSENKCEGHKDARLRKMAEDALLVDDTKKASRVHREQKKLYKGEFHEDAFQLAEETCTIWCVRDFLGMQAWSQDMLDMQKRGARGNRVATPSKGAGGGARGSSSGSGSVNGVADRSDRASESAGSTTSASSSGSSSGGSGGAQGRRKRLKLVHERLIADMPKGSLP